MSYIKVEFLLDPPLVAYQEVDDTGTVLRYLDDQGALLFDVPLESVICVVTDPDPPRLPWMQ
jgi:hypothetical protein